MLGENLAIIVGSEEVEEREMAVDPSVFAASDAAKTIVRDAATLVLDYEASSGNRKNKRRPADQENFDKIIDIIVSGLMYDYLLGNGGGRYVSRSNRARAVPSRYRSRLQSKMLPALLDALAAPQVALIEQEVAAPHQGSGKATVIRMGGSLRTRMELADVKLSDFGLRDEGETIILKRVKDQADFWDEGGLEDYADTPATQALRSEVEEINGWLAGAQLDFNDPGLDLELDIRNRRLRRVFTQGRFTSGGRLFGGFWQEMKKEQRRRSLTICGEEAVELDYGQAGARILYGMAGHSPPAKDLYETLRYPGRRDGIKRVMGAMMFSTKRLERMPQGTRSLFHHSDTVAEVTKAIEAHHPLLVDHFHRGLGHEVQFIESQIMMRLLTMLRSRGVIALPIHDAVMVGRSAATRAKQVMLEAFREVAGIDGVVTIEGLD